MVGLIVLATAAFALGVVLERSSEEPATEGSGTEAPAHEAGGEAVKGSGEEGGGEVVFPASGEPNGEESVAGVDPESTPLVAFAIVASLLLAAGCWFRPGRRWLLVVTAFAMAAFAVLDLRELIHQLDESNTGLAVMAVVVAILHVAAAVAAAVLARRSRAHAPPAAA